MFFSNLAIQLSMAFRGSQPLITNLPHTLQRYYTENSKHIFPEGTARPQSQFLYSHVSVCDLYISMIGLHILLQKNRWTAHGNIINRSQTHIVDIGTEAAQFLFWKCINPNFFAVWSTHFFLPDFEKSLFGEFQPFRGPRHIRGVGPHLFEGRGPLYQQLRAPHP